MTQRFDPDYERRHWDRWLFRFFEKHDVLQKAPTARNHFSQLVVASLVEAYLIGYADSVRALLKRQLAGMLSVAEPTRAKFGANSWGEAAWCCEVYEWRQALGVCKWLSGEPAEKDLASALEAARNRLEVLRSADDFDGEEEQAPDVALHLATALAGDVPGLGLECLGRWKFRSHYGSVGPLLGFGAWACQHLVSGGLRDREFLARGQQALTATLLPFLLPDARKIDIALWLKAIYFDSGVARTAEQAMMLAYDCMPDIARPVLEGPRAAP